MKEKRTIYYESEKDDFFKLDENNELPRIDEDYDYDLREKKRIKSFIAYRILATPAAYLYTKLKFRERIIDRSAIKAYRGVGIFIVGNHTQPIADAFTPNIIAFPRKNSIVITKDNFALPVLGRALPYLGGIPLPETPRAARAFTRTVETRIKRGEAVTIYPEAHVWEYYTGIRELDPSAFDLPVRFGAPVFSATRVYRRSAIGVRCKIYLDGPFIPDQSLPKKEARERLSLAISKIMKERAKESDVEVVRYIRRSESNERRSEE